MLPPFWYRKHLEACNKRGKDQARKYSSGHGAIGRAVSTLLLSSPLIRDTGGLLVTMPSLVGGCQVLGDGWKLVEDHKPSISPCSVCLRACLRLGEPTHLHAWRTAVSLPHLCLLCSVFYFFIMQSSLFLSIFILPSFFFSSSTVRVALTGSYATKSSCKQDPVTLLLDWMRTLRCLCPFTLSFHMCLQLFTDQRVLLGYLTGGIKGAGICDITSINRGGK